MASLVVAAEIKVSGDCTSFPMGDATYLEGGRGRMQRWCPPTSIPGGHLSRSLDVCQTRSLPSTQARPSRQAHRPLSQKNRASCSLQSLHHALGWLPARNHHSIYYSPMGPTNAISTIHQIKGHPWAAATKTRAAELGTSSPLGDGSAEGEHEESAHPPGSPVGL